MVSVVDYPQIKDKASQWLAEADRLLSPNSEKYGDQTLRMLKLEQQLTQYPTTGNDETVQEKRKQLEQAIIKIKTKTQQSPFSPIYPIERSVSHLFLKVTNLAKQQPPANSEAVKDLRQEYASCCNNLQQFNDEQIKNNQLELPQVTELEQRSENIKKKLTEITFYLENLEKAPETITALAHFRESHSSSPKHLTLAQRKQDFQQMLEQLPHPLLRDLMANAFSRNELYFWIYDSDKLQHTANLIQTFLTTQPKEQQSYAILLHYLNQQNAVLLPFTETEYAQLLEKKYFMCRPEQLDTSRQQLREITPQLRNIQTKIKEIESTAQSLLKLHTHDSAEKLLENYAIDWQPRLKQLKNINELIATLNDCQKSLTALHNNVYPALTDGEIMQRCRGQAMEDAEAISYLQQRKDLLRVLGQHELAAQRLLTHVEDLKKQFRGVAAQIQASSEARDVARLSLMDNDAAPAFFDTTNNPTNSSGPTPEYSGPEPATKKSYQSVLTQIAENLHNH